MSHSSTAPNGTFFIHNSDLSGDVEIGHMNNAAIVNGPDLVWLVKRSQHWLVMESIATVIMERHHGADRPECTACEALIAKLVEAVMK